MFIKKVNSDNWNREAKTIPTFIISLTYNDFSEPHAGIATTDSGWANFSAFDQEIEPAANPLLVSSPNPSNTLLESGSTSSNFPSKTSGLENSDNISNHKSEAAIALKDDIQAVKNYEATASDKCNAAAEKEA